MDARQTSTSVDLDPSVLLAAFNRAAVGMAVVGRGGRVVHANRELTALLGTVTDWASFPPVIRELAVGDAGPATATNGRLETMLRPNLRVRWTVLGIDGHGWLVQAENVTVLAGMASLREAIRLSDERLITIASLHRLVEQTDFDGDVTTTVELIAERARALLGTSGIAVGQIDGDELAYIFAVGTPELLRLRGLRVSLRGSLIGVAIRSGQPEVCHDTETDPRVDQASCRAAGIRSMIVVPLRREGRITAVVNVFSAEPHAFQPSDVQTVELIGGVISAVYGHAADLATKRALLAELQANIAALRTSESKLARAALHDQLTGLPNRAFFMDRLPQALAAAARYHRLVGVLYIDLDHFKQVNDTLGHTAGDALLREIATRLNGCMRGSDTAARIGGDEFTVLCESLTSRDDLVRLAERVVSSIAAPLVLSGVTLSPTASIGAALGGGPADTPERLLRSADDASYEAKRQGRARFSLAPDDFSLAPTSAT